MAISSEAPARAHAGRAAIDLRAVPRAWRLRAALVASLVGALLAGAIVLTLRQTAIAPTQSAAPAVLPIESAPVSPAATTPLTAGQLTQVLHRTALAPNAVNLEITYAPPVFFEVTGKAAPADPKTLVFYLQEDTHIDALDERPTRFSLSVDGQGDYLPTNGVVLTDSGHHRLSTFQFAQPDLPVPQQNLVVSFHFADGSLSTVDWQLPLALPNGTSVAAPTVSTGAAAVQDEALSSAELASLNATLRRVQKNVAIGDATIAEVTVTLATPEYFAAALSPRSAERFTPDQAAVFLLSETSHAADLPTTSLPLTLVYQGTTYQPDLIEPTVSSGHHRVLLVRFPVNPQQSKLLGKLDVQLPDGANLSWGLPVIYTRASATSPLGFTGASILSLVGGMLAAMWPCLFQLTVFFIPALAGVSMEEANSSAKASTRRYVGVAAGLAIIVLALRTAAKVRAPLVCKMPVLSRMANGRKASSPLELMVAGLAFATGCMTCFGAALIIAMVVYVGLAGSALVGGLTLFLFSMGMGVPLVIAAAAMGRAMPVLNRLERITPWMGLASSVIMIGFAIMLMTGNYMAFTAWLLERI